MQNNALFVKLSKLHLYGKRHLGPGYVNGAAMNTAIHVSF